MAEGWRLLSLHGNTCTGGFKHTRICRSTLYANIVVVSEGRSVPTSRQQCVCVRVFGRGLVLGLMGGLKAWLKSSSSFSLIICLTSPSPAALLLWLMCVCAEVSEGRYDEKRLPALCVGNPDKPKHNTKHCCHVWEHKKWNIYTFTLKLLHPYLLKSMHDADSFGVIHKDLEISVFPAAKPIQWRLHLWCSQHWNVIFFFLIFKKKFSCHLSFQNTMSRLLWIIRRPCHDKFSLKLLFTKEIAAIKTSPTCVSVQIPSEVQEPFF